MLLMACASVGCGSFYDYVDSTCYQIKCDHHAKTAWMEVRDLYEGVAFPYNFGEGFRAGYKAVCLGDDTGCPPPMPPRRYWSSCYLNCEGQARAMAWYDGYAHGVVAASCGGCGSHGHVVTGGGTGDGALGSALKGYKPPAPNPYLDQLGPAGYGPNAPRGYDEHGYDPEGFDPHEYGPAPTPFDPSIVPPHGDDLPVIPPPIQGPGSELPPEVERPNRGQAAPEAPAVLNERELPLLPAAEIYRVPVF